MMSRHARRGLKRRSARSWPRVLAQRRSAEVAFAYVSALSPGVRANELELKHGREYRKDPPPPARWRITCIFVDKRHRGQGVARAGLVSAGRSAVTLIRNWDTCCLGTAPSGL